MIKAELFNPKNSKQPFPWMHVCTVFKGFMFLKTIITYRNFCLLISDEPLTQHVNYK